MWRGIVLCAAMLLSQSAAAQDSSDGSPNLLRLARYLRLHVSGGRIEVREHQAGQSRTITAGQPQSAYRQQLQLQARPPCVMVQYEAIDPSGRLTLLLCEKRKLTIERTTSEQSGTRSVRYEQPLTGAVKLTIVGATTDVFTACSLWHLALLQPQECRQLLFPALEILSPDWNLAGQADELQSALATAAAEADVASDEKSWLKLVDRLGSERFSERQVADQALRSGGPAAAAFLQRLDVGALGAEQRLRVQRICQSCADSSTDTPQRVTARLLGDRSLWLGLLSSEQTVVRQTAAEHLCRLVGRPIVFDLRGDEKTREREIAELARRLGIKK